MPNIQETKLKINSIFGGISPSQYFKSGDQYNTAVAVDCDLPIVSTDVRTSGFAVPVGYAKFSSTNITAPVIRIINTPKNTLTYAVTSRGELVSYTSSLGTETLIASTITVTIASPAVFSLTAHGLILNDVVYFVTTGALPTGLTVGTAYYVITAGLTANAFQVSTSQGGSAVNTSGSQSGTHSITMACSWAEYYNNFIYLFTGTNISTYGPLNNTPTLAHNRWAGAATATHPGFSIATALTNTTYPTLRSVSMPNHVAKVHGDNSMYFCDFGANSNATIPGQGVIHRINTKKTTNEGDTTGSVVTSIYNALDLPFGFYPTAIESYGTSLMVLGMYTTDTTVNQGTSAFVLWDGIASSWYLGPVYLKDPLGTAILQANGNMYLWTGNSVNGVRLSRYVGGQSTSDIAFLEEGLPPFAGAVDALGNKIIWGGFSTNPTTSNACVWSFGSKDARLPSGLHNIIKTSTTGTTPIVTALKYVQQSSNVTPKAVVAWSDTSLANNGIDQYSTTATLASKMRWMFNIGKKFNVMSIMIPFGGAVAANTTIIPTLYFDDLSSSTALTTINNTNYPSARKVQYKGADLTSAIGLNNLVFELAWTGTNPLPVAFPIEIGIEIKENES